MTPCPNCDEIQVIKTNDWLNHPWHVTCSCRYAWANSSYFRTKREAKKNWESFMREWDRNQLKEPMR